MGETATRTNSVMVDGLRMALRGGQRDVLLLVVLLLCAFATVALLGYSPHDPTWLHPGPGVVDNPCGPLGAFVADVLLQLVGHGAWLTFVGMVVTVLAIAGRSVLTPGRAVAFGVLVLALLAMLDAGLGPGDAYEPGGVLGDLIAALLMEALGSAGTWLVLVGIGGIAATVLFRIDWRNAMSQSVGTSERMVTWTSRVAYQAVVRSISDAGSAVWTTISESFDRMSTSLTRRDTESESWGPITDLELMEGSPDAYAPESYVEPTAISAGPVGLATVQYVETDNTRSADLLGLFPQLAPRARATPSGGLYAAADSAVPPGDATPDRQVLLEASDASDALAGMPWPAQREVSSKVKTVRAGQPRSAPKAKSMTKRKAKAKPQPAPASNAAPASHAAEGPDFIETEPASQGGARIQAADGLQQRNEDDGSAVRKSTAGFRLPVRALLDDVPEQEARYDEARLERMAARVEETLASFKVTGKVTDVRVGPVVTTFEFLPDRGISVRKVSSLEDDLAMGLRALSVRIVAPIPGKGVVGIEIPSEHRQTIYLREMLASPEFTKHKGALPVVLGKDVSGASVVADLAKMPHLLVGGTTGSGKSVGVNGMLLSLLFRKTPEELRLLLVDPKRLEFKMYEEIPHLLHPVVTEPKQAAAALAWACREMDSRYELLARWDCRNISGYNQKVERELRAWTPQKARRYAPSGLADDDPYPTPAKLPHIVIVIDELADLMLVAKKEVEGSIARLTQMARACGIHLIVATQRPSVDVVTGLIKSNLPTRISFKLRSGTDSRTILDTTGADALLGRGDMLYLPNAGDLMRVHGPFASDDETLRVLDFLREQGEPEFVEGVVDDPASVDNADLDEDVDPLFDQAVELCQSAGKASTSMIQRRFKIGYNRAARIVDQMEARGIVGPADGARPREVLVSGSGL